MDKRFWLWLLLLLLFSPSTALAQHFRNSTPPPRKPSHHDVPGGFDPANAQEMMAQRLSELHELHQLQDKVRKLLNDPGSRNEIEKLLQPSDLKRLRDKILEGEGFSQDPAWRQLLQTSSVRRELTDGEIKFLHNLATRREFKPPTFALGKTILNTGDKDPPTPTPPPDSSSPSPPSPTQAEPGPSLIDRLQEQTTKWLVENFEDVSGDMLQALTEMGAKEGNTPLAELLRSVPQADFSGLNASEHPLVAALQTGTLSRYLSNAGDFLRRQSGAWDKVGSLMNKASLPSLPRMGGPSVAMRSASASEGDAWLPLLLCLLTLGVIVLFLCLRGLGSKALPGSGADREWRLGSWPVSPNAVSTRQDVIRAFEYLALLCFGSAAVSCHHHQLAQRLAEQDSNNPGRRQTAEMLAWLYEQARYAPAEETLSQEQLSDARKAFCSLAGVTTA